MFPLIEGKRTMPTDISNRIVANVSANAKASTSVNLDSDTKI